ncbi:short chain dehydrogenase [Aerosticca soli]|jgi:NAD(P)-dependent dehydrogenase (short-subunit alcohol dehydrogenase family)|uniref:Short chain dehydrogenase n=1 Tax=Aerosticca soli TaxID=2010829 RepID=A0A2Z6E6H5_9GAMM|nr:short chain dehydrogenase [Aerosticca soli]MDI3258656.1 short chain dehydrogenase [Nevskiaceae bacterium]BBD80301.1 short chain dehydrogenase [Aerosticca soli]
MKERRLRILLVGAGGTIGRAIAAELGARHAIIGAGRRSGDLHFDLADPAGMREALAGAGPLDAVICAAGNTAFAPLADFVAAPYGASLHTLGLADKLLGQVNLALAARDVLAEGGSITLTTGLLAEEPVVEGSSSSLVNGALQSFVRAAAIELPRGLRINAVSPGVVAESLDAYAPYFRGFDPVPAARVALAYSRSVEGAQTGQVYRVH